MTLIGEFIIPTQSFPNKNPLGYTRTTQQSKWNQQSKLYERWKDFIAECFKKQCGELRIPVRKKSKLDIMIYYSSARKCDPSNVFKGVEDSLADKKMKFGGQVIIIDKRLYKDDNWNIGSFNFDFDKKNPRIEVKIYQ